jgi:PAS domain S-box-containing protein
VLWSLLDVLADGIILVTDDGALALANFRAEDMFGYPCGGLTGQPVEALVPEVLREAHAAQRAAYQQDPADRPMGTRGRLAGLRTDGATFPLQVSLSPVPTATGHLTLAVIRDLTHPQSRADLAALARAVAAGQETAGRDLVDRITSGLYHFGLTLHEAGTFPREQAVQRIESALRELDDLIREIRDYVFTSHAGPPGTQHP